MEIGLAEIKGMKDGIVAERKRILEIIDKYTFHDVAGDFVRVRILKQEIGEMKNKFILDACCGGRMFWFNKHHPNTIYLDNRIAEKGTSKLRPNFEVNPDQVMDFRELDFEDKSFKLVVFDPPHLFLSPTSEMRKKYGSLNKDSWKIDLREGFDNCWRVLEDYGILVFKWNESQISISEVLKIFDKTPLFGHPTAKSGKTLWCVFMKIPEECKSK